jgi:NADPH:quinone reductase-like Zn-dependent oxidoreductase
MGAVLPVPALTADETLRDDLSIKSGETLLVHGGGGVTGSLMVQLAVGLGATVIAAASAHSADRLRNAGAACVVDYRSAAWADDIVRWTSGRRVDAAANAVPGSAAQVLPLVRSKGRLATITSDPPASVRGIAVHNVYVTPNGTRLQHLVDLLASGKISLSMGRALELDSAEDALRQVGRGGAVVLGVRS